MTTISQVLKTDKKHRTKGVTGDLHTMDSLVSDLSLDYDLPTLCGKNIERPNILMTNKDKFNDEFYKRYPFLKKINMNNLLIAGGSISNIIRGQHSYGGDIDFFVYGLNKKKPQRELKNGYSMF
ncbi:hypothetical protein CE11_00489 [Megavirus courdo11]|uniref:Ankyrin repeat protein n=1 Tax=Megavirus courdo11 TaxID=1128140 RepID=K7Z814_9VIRU|nr:hypothetical protein CE11_00489 [Megavirus courdo11]